MLLYDLSSEFLAGF